jgi:hypothetical protein
MGRPTVERAMARAREFLRQIWFGARIRHKRPARNDARRCGTGTLGSFMLLFLNDLH